MTIVLPSHSLLTAEEKFQIGELYARQLPDETAGVSEDVRTAAGVAEYYGTMAALFGARAAEYSDLVTHRPWFDHRRHIWDPDKRGGDHWIVSMAHILVNIPMDGHLLDLACGDGWYCYNAFRHRTSKLVAVDNDPAAIAIARRLWSDPGIEYVLADICEYEPGAQYDTVSMRGAAHCLADLPRTLKMVHRALRPGGRFVGDDLATTKDIPIITAALREEFGDGATWTTLVSRDRNTLLWNCRAGAA